QADLLQVVHALRAPGGLPRRLDRGDEQRGEDAEDRGEEQQPPGDPRHDHQLDPAGHALTRARLGDDQLPPALPAPGPTARLLVPGLELLSTFACDNNWHGRPSPPRRERPATPVVASGGRSYPPVRRGATSPRARPQAPSFARRNSRARSSAAGT